MRMSNAFPSKYVTAGDLQGRDITVTISSVAMETMQNGDNKPAVYFQNTQKGMVLNKTNSNTIARAYGDEADNWTGKTITLYPTTTEFAGEVVDAIRIRPIQQNTGQAPMGQPASQPVNNDGFNQPAQGRSPEEQYKDASQGGEGPSTGGGLAHDLDDSIPFAPETRI